MTPATITAKRGRNALMLALLLPAILRCSGSDEETVVRFVDRGQDLAAETGVDSGAAADGGPSITDPGRTVTGPVELGDPTCQAEPFGLGCSCQDDESCASEWCVEDWQGRVCANLCGDSDCPSDFRCVGVGAIGADRTVLCAPRNQRLCRPCTTHEECRGDATGEDELCVRLGEHGHFCGSPCDVGAGHCPGGFVCEEVEPTPGAAKVGQCVPVDGVCSCPAPAVGNETRCVTTTELGYCVGSRRCTDVGLSECTANENGRRGCEEACTDVRCVRPYLRAPLARFMS